MAINKKLIYFNDTLANFKSSANGLNGQTTKDANGNVGNIPFASIVFTNDGFIWTHCKEFNGNNTSAVTSVNGKTGAVTLNLDDIADGSTRKLANYLPLSGGTVATLTVTGAATFSQAINGNISGNAATASRLLNARTISLSGSVTGSGTFDGSGNLSITTTTNHNFDGRYLRWGGSSADVTAMGWGTLTTANGYTILSHAASSDGGDWGMVNKGGQIFMQLDGYYYQREGQYRVIDTSEITSYGSRNNGANKIVTTDSNGYLYTGWINTTSGPTTSTIDRIYASNDGFIRYVTPATFRTQVIEPYYVNLTGTQTISGNKTFSSSVSIDDLTAGNLVVSGGASFALTINGNISGTSTGIAGYTFKSGITNTANSGWTNTSTDDKIIPTMNFIAYWNGAYNSGGSSNLTYCCKGAFGTATTHAHTDYVTSISYDSTNRKLQLSKGGGTATDIVTFGSHAFDSTAYLPTSGGTLSNNVPNILTLKRTDSGGGAFIDYYHAGQTTHYWRAGSNQTGVFTFYYDGSTETLAFTDSAISYKLNTIYHTGNLSIGTLMGSTAIGDSDEPVYWSGTAFVKAGAYPTKASWNYDDVYLKLSGGTLTGTGTILTLSNKSGGDCAIKFLRSSNTAWSILDSGGNLSFIEHNSGTTIFKLYESTLGTKAEINGNTVWHAGNLTTSAAADGGTTKSLVTTGDKYKWNLVYDWLTTTTADTDTTINKWKELEAFLTSITESDTLTGLLALYLPLSGGKMSGPIEFERSGTSFSILQWSSSYPNYGIWYYNSDVDKMALSASGNANSTNGADLCINGNGDGTVTIRGNTIIHTGNYSSYVYSKTTSDGRYVYKSGDTMTGSLTTPSLTVTGAATFSLAINGSILGNAATASRLLNARNIAISGAVTGNANFDGSGNITISTSVNHTHSYAGSSSAGGAATNVVVNSGNNSASTYPLVWHSGNTLYSTSDVYVNPSTDVIYNKGVETTGRVKAKSGNNMVQLIPDSDCGLYMTSSGQWLHIAGSGSNMYIYNGTWDTPGAGNYNKGIIIDTSNNIGIGTTSPSYKLHVSGGLLAITNNSNTVTIGSQNTSWCHIESGKQFYMSNSVWVNGTLGVYNGGSCNYYINNATSVLNDLRVSGADLYIGSASGSQCHQQYDSTNKILKFIFD